MHPGPCQGAATRLKTRDFLEVVRVGSKSILMFTALAALPASLALAQPTQPTQPQRAPVAATPVQTTPASPPVAQPAPQGAVTQPQPQPALPPPPPPPPPLWTAADANQLLMTILTS